MSDGKALFLSGVDYGGDCGEEVLTKGIFCREAKDLANDGFGSVVP